MAWGLALVVAGCSSSETEPLQRWELPAGRPAAIALADLQQRWTDLDDGTVLVPAEDLDAVLEDRARWAAYAQALEAAGRWAR